MLLLVGGWSSCGKDTHPAAEYEVKGIDVSRYQLVIDWHMVAAGGVDFAFVKASEGGDFRDERFSANWTGLLEAGIHRGAYHYFRPEVSSRRQANNYINAVGPLKRGDLPPVLDVEERGREDHAVFLEGLRQWLTLVEERYGVKPIIYTGQKFYNRHLAGYFPDHKIWVARYKNEEPTLADGRQFSFWQYTDKGRIPGISGPVDINVFAGNHLDLALITLDHSTVGPGPVTKR